MVEGYQIQLIGVIAIKDSVELLLVLCEKNCFV